MYVAPLPFLLIKVKIMDIFDYIEQKSNEIGNKIGEGETEDDKEIYRYAVFGIFSQIFTFGIAFLIAWLLNMFIPFFIVVSSFVLLRIGGGGYHCSCFRDCFITSLTVFFCGTFIAYLTQNYAISMFIISLLLGIYIIPQCPKPSINSPSRGYKEDKKFRYKYIRYFVLLMCFNLIFIYYKHFLFSTAISSGIIISVFMISDIGEYILKNIWDIIHKNN